MIQLPTLDIYSDRYKNLDKLLEEVISRGEDPANLLISFPLATLPFENTVSNAKVTCEYEELTAFCPWTSLPDQGKVYVEYRPKDLLLELKSYKYYLLAFRDYHITQEHLAQKVFNDLMNTINPAELMVELDYMPRGGIHTTVRFGHRS